MRLMYWGKDGGPESTVWGFWPIEIKGLFSVALLRFEDGSRDAYHNHAFNSVSWLIKGELHEDYLDGKGRPYLPSLRPIITRRHTFHKVSSVGRSYVLTFRGPWTRTWMEFRPEDNQFVELTNGRQETKRW